MRAGRRWLATGVAALIAAVSTITSAAPAAAATPQAITFTLPASGLVGAMLVLNGTADSGLPVVYATSTASICSASDSSLQLLAPGTCTVTASQPGDESFLAAPDVVRSMVVEAVPQGVDLGRYAVNGTVQAAVSDATTGTTYIGGDFTSIGLRTGPVAVVDPPGAGDGALRAASPEILGTVNGVYADDRPGDPGFFVVGELTAVNGAPVPQVPIIRMHLDTGGTHWVVDPSWMWSDPSETCQGIGKIRSWVTTSTTLFAGLYTYSFSPTGVWRVDRATGTCTPLAAEGSPPLPELTDCTTLPYCLGHVGAMAIDPGSGRLLVAYDVIVTATSGQEAHTLVVAAFDPATGHRAWLTELQGERPSGDLSWDSWITGLAATGGVVVARGTFRFDVDDTADNGDGYSRTVVLDAATGTITHRWNTFGEESLVDGSTIGPGTRCLTDGGWTGPMVDAFGTPSQWLATGDGRMSLCQYESADGSVTGSFAGTWSLPVENPWRVPVLAASIGGTRSLVGPWSAVSLADGSTYDWHPDPGTPYDGPAWLTSSGGGIVIGGDFNFTRGASMPGVAALRADMSPDPGFVSPLDPAELPAIRALALDEDWLLVGGQYYLAGTAPKADRLRAIGALDPATGAAVDWQPAATTPAIVNAIAVNPATTDFWIGGRSLGFEDAPATSLQHFAAPTKGAGPLAAPTIGCLTAPALGIYSDPSLCAPAGDGTTEVRSLVFDETGALYIAGLFGSVNGATHRGIARLGADGALDSWSANLLGALPIPSGSGLEELAPHAIAVSHGRVLVGGRFCSVRPLSSGGATSTCISPLLVFDQQTGVLVRPTDADRQPWFPIWGWWTAGWGIIARDSGIVVALGDVGLVVLDPNTLDYDSAASEPYVNREWWSHDSRTGVFALAAPLVPPTLRVATVDLTTIEPASAYSTRVILGGVIPRWGYRVAGNVAAASVAATPHLPTVTAPVASIRKGPKLSGARIPVVLTWAGADVGGPGIARYELARTTDGGAHWTTISSGLTGSRRNILVAPSGTVRFRVRAVDRNGVVGAWAIGSTLSPRLVQQSSKAVRYHHTWRTVRSSKLSGGSAKYASRAGSSVRYTFTGRSVAVVTTRARSRGKANVYVDGKYVATVNLRSSATQHRRVVWSRTWSTRATHTVKLVVVGTRGHPRVDIDAFAVLR